jgi:DNA-binding transcriptional LysR family regulator
MDLQATIPNLLNFCVAYELCSFSKAARRLGVTPQAVSRSVQRLEETLGLSLFRRTTRVIAPTDAGHLYFRTAQEALRLIERAEASLQEVSEVRSGVVRLSAPTTYGHYRLVPLLAPFRERFPQIELEVHLDNRNVDFKLDEFDLAIRMGTIASGGLIARKLGQFTLGVYASPSYLARYTEPRHPSQLEAHQCIGFVRPSTGRVMPWSFSAGSRSFTPRATLRCGGDFLGAITLAKVGLGLVQAYDFLVQDELKRGVLVEVLREFRGSTRPFSLIYPSSPEPTPAARVLIEYLREFQGL